jgi:DNA-binding response OmpR family regulator
LGSTAEVTLLIVEDEPRIAQFVRRGFTARGYEVEVVERGLDALERAPDADLIILDLGLPDIDGIEVLQRLRDRGDDVPVIVLTARSSVENRVQALELGADDYVMKPFAFEELAARVAATLRRARPARTQAETCEHRVLIVEDSARVAAFVVHDLERAGLEVIVAENTEVARKRTANERFDLVILDLGPPVRSRFDLLRSLRAAQPELPILLLMERAEPAMGAEALAAGATDYLTAPFVVDDVHQRVMASLRIAE